MRSRLIGLCENETYPNGITLEPSTLNGGLNMFYSAEVWVLMMFLIHISVRLVVVLNHDGSSHYTCEWPY